MGPKVITGFIRQCNIIFRTQGKADNQDSPTTDQNTFRIKLGIPLVTMGTGKDKVNIMTDNVITKDSKWYYDPEMR